MARKNKIQDKLSLGVEFPLAGIFFLIAVGLSTLVYFIYRFITKSMLKK